MRAAVPCLATAYEQRLNAMTAIVTGIAPAIVGQTNRFEASRSNGQSGSRSKKRYEGVDNDGSLETIGDHSHDRTNFSSWISVALAAHLFPSPVSGKRLIAGAKRALAASGPVGPSARHSRLSVSA